MNVNRNRVSSFYPPAATGEYVSPFTAPAMPNLSTLGSAPHKPFVAEAARIPRAPLSPQKLAKLANALGVSAPLPASGSPSSSGGNAHANAGAFGAFTGNSRSNSLGRSPVPRSASSSPGFGSQTAPGGVTPALTPGSSSSGSGNRTTSVAGAAARYFIHVIPPTHFPHPRRRDPEAFAAFRRGALVPVHATLQNQLSAIAREYQLPATSGVVLYLVAEHESGRSGLGEVDGVDVNGVDDTSKLGKGPRISEDVWKWLWMKISEEQPVSRVGLGLTTEGATLPQTGQSLLRKLSSSSKLNTEYGKTFYPLSSSSKSTVTPAEAEGETEAETEEGKDAKELSPLDPSTSSQFSTTSSNPSTAETPATSSFEFDTRLLPGLGSTSAIPVLAKVEFDIDRSVGAWYEKWRRSRRALQKRRADKGETKGKVPLRITVNGKKGSVSPSSGSSSSDEEDGAEETGYSKLSESEPEEENEAATRRGGDPLADVFGTDGETWQDAQSARPHRKKKKGGDLALSGAELTALPSPGAAETPGGAGSDKEEVMALWNQQGQPQLDGSALHPEGLGGSRKPVPPPLNMAASMGPFLDATTVATASPYASSYDSDSTRLPYLSESDPKRLGGIYDDLELDLADDIDLEAHRAQQLKVGQELDVLERNLAQFSPRALVSVDLTPDLMLPPESPYFRSAPPETTSFPPITGQTQVPSVAGGERKRMVPTLQQLMPAKPSMMEMEDDFARPPMFRQPKLVGTPSPDTGSFDRGAPGFNTASSSAEGLSQAAWPAVPYSALANRNGDVGPLSPKSTSSLKLKGAAASPPRVVLNGNAGGNGSGGEQHSNPKPLDERRKNPSVSSVFSTASARSISESLARSKQYEEDTGYYDAEAVALPPSLGRRTEERSGSPGIPLSPDPFGRFPSSSAESPLTLPPERTSSLTNERHSHTPSSRFSVDSVKEDQSQSQQSASASSLKPNNSRGTLVSMKSIRRLWRTKNKSSISGASLPPSPDPSTMPSRPPSSALSLQFSEAATMSRTPSPPNLSTTPTTAFSAGMGMGMNINMTLPGSRGGLAKQAQKGGSGSSNNNKRPDSGLDPFYFDQDPRYPSRRSPSPEASSGSGSGQYQFPKTRTPPLDAAPSLYTSAVSPPAPHPPSSASSSGKRSSIRKSLIRRKNGGGSDAGGSSQSESTSGSGSTGSAGVGGEPRRRRRPSLLDMAGLMRGSVSSVHSPSVPELPVEFRQSNGQHSRAQSRSSLTAMAVLNSAAEREREGSVAVSSSSISSITTAGSRKQPTTQTSTDSSQESSEALLTPVSSVAPLVFGKGRRGSRLGRVSAGVNGPVGGGLGEGEEGFGEEMEGDGDAASFDESQFEIVSPRVDRFTSGVVYAPSGVIVHRDD